MAESEDGPRTMAAMASCDQQMAAQRSVPPGRPGPLASNKARLAEDGPGPASLLWREL